MPPARHSIAPAIVPVIVILIEWTLPNEETTPFRLCRLPHPRPRLDLASLVRLAHHLSR